MVERTWCIDTHVHYYPCFSLEHFLNSAYENLRAIGQRSSLGAEARCALCLLDTAQGSVLAGILIALGGLRGEMAWSHTEGEPEFGLVRLSRPDGANLYLVAGRQVVTQERLEVLLLGLVEPLDISPLPAVGLLEEYQHRCLVAIPWGFGKWLGARGRLVCDLLENCDAVFCLGDNAGRPSLWRGIPQFRLAAERGVAVLPGTDPLPLPRHATGAGRSGVVVAEDGDGVTTGMELSKMLAETGRWALAEQRTSGLVDVIYDQLTLRIAQ